MGNTISYFTGEQYSEFYEQIIGLAEEMGYSVRVYESKEATQFDFMQAVYRDTAIIVDATIPDDMSLSTVYPILTAHVNTLDHVLVFSDNYYEDGSQVLPLNITPLRQRTYMDKDLLAWIINDVPQKAKNYMRRELLAWLRMQLEDLKNHQNYKRFEIESIESLINFKERMEQVVSVSLEMHKPKKKDKTRVLISYRSSCNKEVELFVRRMEENGEVEIKMLPSGSLCDDYEAHTPMRRWMLVGMLDDYIRSVDEVWVYYNEIYTHSWWTLAEMVMTAYVNYDRAEEDEVKVVVYDVVKNHFMERGEKGYPEFLHVSMDEKQFSKLARLLSNTRPDAMGPENNDNMKSLKLLAWMMRFMTKKKRGLLVEQMRSIFEMGVPNTIPMEERKGMVEEMVRMYSDPKEILRYANDDVFKDTFWNNISYQTNRVTAAFKDDSIDVDAFIDTPMKELTKYRDENLRTAAYSNLQVKLNGKKYYVGEGKKRYLWLATRMGIPTVEDAPGLEVLQTYNLLSHDQIVGMVMKNLL